MQCEPCPSVSTGEWFSDLMVCNVNPRNATLIWTRDENTVNATYIVLYEVTGNQIRSDLVSFHYHNLSSSEAVSTVNGIVILLSVHYACK